MEGFGASEPLTKFDYLRTMILVRFVDLGFNPLGLDLHRIQKKLSACGEDNFLAIYIQVAAKSDLDLAGANIRARHQGF